MEKAILIVMIIFFLLWSVLWVRSCNEIGKAGLRSVVMEIWEGVGEDAE